MGIERIGRLSILGSRTDEEAMWRVKLHDDHREFARLMDRWESPIRNLCARMTGDLHRGEDLKQETFSKVFEKRKDYEAVGRFSTWLRLLAPHICYANDRQADRQHQFLVHDYDTATGGLLFQ